MRIIISSENQRVLFTFDLDQDQKVEDLFQEIEDRLNIKRYWYSLRSMNTYLLDGIEEPQALLDGIEEPQALLDPRKHLWNYACNNEIYLELIPGIFWKGLLSAFRRFTYHSTYQNIDTPV